MPHYAVLIFERNLPTSVEEVPPELMAKHRAMPGRVIEAGGRTLAAVALCPPETATSIRDGVVTDGPFIESKEALAGLFVLEARDLDHAIAIARMTPVSNGAVEVRPMLGFSPDGS